MQFIRLSVLTFFCLFFSTLAAPIESQTVSDPNIYEKSVQRLLDATNAYIKALEALKTTWSTARTTEDLQVRSQSIAVEIERSGRAIRAAEDAGVSAMANAQPAGYAEATLSIPPLVLSLEDKTEKAGQLLESMTSIIGDMGGLDSMIRLLTDIDTGAILFTNMVVKKMPTGSGLIGNFYGTRIQTAIEKAIQALQSEKQKRTSTNWWG